MITRNPEPEFLAAEIAPPATPPLDALFGRPLLPATCAFIAGILSYGSWPAACAALVAFIAIAAVFRDRIPFALLAIAVGFFALGSARLALSTGPTPADVSRFIGQGYVTIRGAVISDPEPSTNSTAFLMRVVEVDSADGPTPCEGNMLARIPRSTGPFEYGDGLEIRGPIQQPGGAENPGLFRYPEYLARMGVYSSVAVQRPTAVRPFTLPVSGIDRLARAMQRARFSAIWALDRSLPPLEGNLLSGIVLGQRTRLPKELTDDFGATGTTHILASSGMNVGIVAMAVFWLTRRLGFRRSRAIWFAIPAMLAYTLLAGAKPSVVRADVMATVFLAAYVVNREPDLPSAMALAALILLVWNPGSLYDPGFQLSFVVVAALVAVLPLLEPTLLAALGVPGRRAPATVRLRHWLVGGIVVTSVAQLAALPLTAQHFNQISLLGIVANALILMWIPILFCGGFVVWGAALISPVLGKAVAWPLGFLLAYVIGVARTCGSVPFAVINVKSPGWALIALYYAGFAYVIWRLRELQTRRAGETP